MGTVPIEKVYGQIAEFVLEAGARLVILFCSRARGPIALIPIRAWLEAPQGSPVI